jgi:23S rRNA (adenine2503-C2)-methyltransferase
MVEKSTERVKPLLGMSCRELTEWMVARGEPNYRGKQLYQWLYQKGARSFADITVFSKAWRESNADVDFGRSTIHHRTIANDGTVKFLLQLADGEIIECVGIPTAKRLTVCVSSQVGCAMGCTFCATGKGGFSRHLYPHEIVDQVLTVQNEFQDRVTHIVFMGMGEPLANLKNTIVAVEILNQDVGIGQRNITISTVGLPGKIAELADYQLQTTLAVSLHAPNQQLRVDLIPTAIDYPFAELMNECREYVKATGRRVSFEYILLSGVNDLPSQARELASHLRGFQCHVNLIPYNPIDEADYQRSDRQRIDAFTNELTQRNIAASVRYSRGLSADAACGQLRKNSNKLPILNK